MARLIATVAHTPKATPTGMKLVVWSGTAGRLRVCNGDLVTPTEHLRHHGLMAGMVNTLNAEPS